MTLTAFLASAAIFKKLSDPYISAVSRALQVLNVYYQVSLFWYVDGVNLYQLVVVGKYSFPEER